MSNTGNQETGGVSIKPSARPSIHGHSFCPFAYTEAIMGRYGVEKSNREQRAQSNRQRTNQSPVSVANDHGTDEVDNAFSKPANPIFPSSLNQINGRRKSFGTDTDTDKDSSNKISQSLPATFSLHSHYSDDSEVETPVRRECSDASFQSVNLTPQKTPVINRRYNTSNLNRSGSLSPRTHSRAKQSPDDRSKIAMPLLVVVGVLVIIGSLFNTSYVSSKGIYDESRFNDDIDLLGVKYKIDIDAMLQMQTGIATIFKKQDTGSFMFVYNSNDYNFNMKEFDAFINDVSNIAAKYLRNESTPVHYTVMEGSSLNMFGHSELMKASQSEVDKTGVLLVKHLEAVPSDLAMAFHYYCDEYNPLVKKSAILFTLNLAKCPAARDKSTHAVIEKCLAQKWNSLPAENIGPLLTRVVSVVINVTGAFSP